MKNTKENIKDAKKDTNNETNDEMSIETPEYAAPKNRGGSRTELSAAEMPLLFLIPLVETAWAHGAIARGEKQLIFDAAREEGIAETDRLNETLDELLVYQPGQRFFDECLSLIKTELAAMSVKERGRQSAKILNRCRKIAAAAHGNSAMDVDKSVSPEEREVLERIASELNFRDDSQPSKGRESNRFSVSKA